MLRLAPLVHECGHTFYVLARECAARLLRPSDLGPAHGRKPAMARVPGQRADRRSGRRNAEGDDPTGVDARHPGRPVGRADPWDARRDRPRKSPSEGTRPTSENMELLVEALLLLGGVLGVGAAFALGFLRGLRSSPLFPLWVARWLAMSSLIVTWDALFVLLRPWSMSQLLWAPYRDYVAIDRLYADVDVLAQRKPTPRPTNIH